MSSKGKVISQGARKISISLPLFHRLRYRVGCEVNVFLKTDKKMISVWTNRFLGYFYFPLGKGKVTKNSDGTITVQLTDEIKSCNLKDVTISKRKMSYA